MSTDKNSNARAAGTRARQARVLRVGSEVWIHHEGRTISTKVNVPSRGRSHAPSAQSADTGNIRSPMPGKILKLNYQVNDTVKQGETICVIEAMKMEYPLKAPFDGKVKALYKKAGELVALDEELIEIEK